jgi:hypothetical protein
VQGYGSCIVIWKYIQVGVLRWHGLSWMESYQIRSCFHHQLIFQSVNFNLKLLYYFDLTFWPFLLFNIGLLFFISWFNFSSVMVFEVWLEVEVSTFSFFGWEIYLYMPWLYNCIPFVWVKISYWKFIIIIITCYLYL